MSSVPSSSAHASTYASDHTDALVDGAARLGTQAVHRAGEAVDEAVDALNHRIASGRARVRPALHELAGGLEDLAHERLDAVRERARSARLAGAGYIRERPLPSLLMAASAGAALVLIGGWLLRPHGNDRRDR
ncbi:hypothetical protein [Leptothrix discophora]|uniref:DUF883 domain-containing protein n=1 Tax=Leptothrix discophora TaxID=89 RepID=A0ABT9G8I6_LEPDI|nr:hypothetical protein [Leptothrix discophora]MDP4302799.1 hypothetical protein [Leptothrix discophora]